jgi:YggT family protein
VYLICVALFVYFIVLILRIILSWATMFWSIPAAMDPVVRVVFDLTEPVLALFRRYIPPIGGLDLSPLIVFLILQAIRAGIGC